MKHLYKFLFIISLFFTNNILAGDPEAGEVRYGKTCINCHGPAGKGVASYPKISGNEVSYTTAMLETYRAGTEVGPNSGLMIMMAKPLTDIEIANLAAYLEKAQYNNNN
jgi:cytochrome c553